MRKLFPIIVLLFVSARLCAGEVFRVRGINIDFRTQVMTMSALKQTVKDAAGEGINTLLIEWEGSFPFRCNASLRNRNSFSTQEIRDFVSWCNSLGVDVIPIQNCFGHCEYILSQPKYSHLREDNKEISQVCPSKEDVCADVFESIFREVAELHTSKYIHIGADETRLLGRCRRCAAKVAEQGVSALFVDYVARMCEIVHSLGKTPIIWADMLLKYPEAASKLPRDLVVLDWNYGWAPNHFGNIDAIRDLGFEIWGAPALRSSPDNIFLTQWKKHFDNLAVYPSFAAEHGYAGLIETSWSTSGTYGVIWDDGRDVYALQPIREVYPLSAFDPLQRAFGKVVNDPCSPFDMDTFLKGYAEDHFGIGPGPAQDTFVAYFHMEQGTVTRNNFRQNIIEKALEDCSGMREVFSSLKVRKNKKDFAHLVLMLDIRANYLSFMLERSRDDGASLEGVKKVVKEGKSLRRRFRRLNRRYLKDPDAPLGKYSYLQAASDLLDVLKNNRVDI